jgi:hypothetical protein
VCRTKWMTGIKIPDVTLTTVKNTGTFANRVTLR